MNNTPENNRYRNPGISNLFVAMTAVEDPKRVEAFGSLYSMMRLIDDLADSLVETPDLDDAGEKQILLQIDQWKQRIKACYHMMEDSSRIDLSLLKAITRFDIPEFLWVDLFRAMTLHLDRSGFPSMRMLLEYARGAAVTPVTMFLIILFSEPDDKGIYSLVSPDVITGIGESIGNWGYILHTLLIEKSYLQGESRRNMLPVDLMERHGVSENHLVALAERGVVDSITQDMVAEYVRTAERTGDPGRTSARKLLQTLPGDRRKALAFLVAVYAEIQKRIIEMDYNIFGEDLIWDDEDRAELLRKVETYDANFDLSVLW